MRHGLWYNLKALLLLGNIDECCRPALRRVQQSFVFSDKLQQELQLLNIQGWRTNVSHSICSFYSDEKTGYYAMKSNEQMEKLMFRKERKKLHTQYLIKSINHEMLCITVILPQDFFFICKICIFKMYFLFTTIDFKIFFFLFLLLVYTNFLFRSQNYSAKWWRYADLLLLPQ